MFLCHRHRLQVKGHEEGGVGSAGAVAAGFLRREMLMVLHHVFMVAFCFPASVVTMTTQVVYGEGVTKIQRFIRQFELPALMIISQYYRNILIFKSMPPH